MSVKHPQGGWKVGGAVQREKVRVLGLQAQDAAARGDLAEAARVLDLALAEFDPRRSPKASTALDRLHLLRAKTAVDAGQAFVLPDRWALPLPEPAPARAPRSERRSRPRKGARADAASVEPKTGRRGRDTSPARETSWEESTSRQTPMQTPAARRRRALRPADLPGLAGRWLGIRPPTKVESVVSAGAMETDRHRH